MDTKAPAVSLGQEQPAGAATHSASTGTNGASKRPVLLHQAIDLKFDFLKEVIYGTTTLWLGFREEIQPGDLVFLNSRQAKLSGVSVNNVDAEIVHNDPLRALSSSGLPRDHAASNVEHQIHHIDSNLRAALEIAKHGELCIKVPDYLSATSKGFVSPLDPLPPRGVASSSVPPIVHERFKHLKHLFEDLLAPAPTATDYYGGEADPFGDDDNDDDNDDELEDDPFNSLLNREPQPLRKKTHKKDYGRLLQIKLAYILQGSATLGYVFRRPEGNAAGGGSCCAYAISGCKPNQSLYDLDGVRCWLPCVDQPDQRAAFDITLHAPAGCQLQASGRRLMIQSRVIARHTQSQKLVLQSFADTGFQFTQASAAVFIQEAYVTSRFFTLHRTTAANVGFFVGKAEVYHMPLFKVRGKYMVALDLHDSLHDPSLAAARNRGHTSRSTSIEPNKRPRYDRQLNNNDAQADEGTTAPEASSDDEFIDDLNDLNTANAGTSRLLYENLVHHSALGLDLALKQMHKLVGRRYTNDAYTQIYVPGLDLAEFIAFDEFTLLDAKDLHGPQQSYLETPHHMTALTAYLYSWFATAMPLLNYIHEFLVHGSIGYILYLYLQTIFSDEEALAHLMKCYDTVSLLEKLNYGELPSLGYSHYPEKYEAAHPWYGSYMVAKSIVVFHVMENRCGGNHEALRMAIQQVLRSPLLSSGPTQLGQQHRSYTINTSAPNSPNPAEGGQLSVYESTSAPYYQIHPPVTPGAASPGYFPDSSYSPRYTSYSPGYTGLQSPGYMYAGSSSPMMMVADGGALGSMSPSLSYLQQQHSPMMAYGSMTSYSPRSTGSYDGGMTAPYLMRTASSGSEDSLHLQTSIGSPNTNAAASAATSDKFFPLYRDCLTGELFLQTIRSFSGVSSHLHEDVFDELVYITKNSTISCKVDIEVDPKVEGKPRWSHIIVDQVGHLRGELSKRSISTKAELPLKICEYRDNRLTDTVLGLHERVSVHSQVLYTRPGRRGGRRGSHGASNATDDDQRGLLAAGGLADAMSAESDLTQLALNATTTALFGLRGDRPATIDGIIMQSYLDAITHVLDPVSTSSTQLAFHQFVQIAVFNQLPAFGINLSSLTNGRNNTTKKHSILTAHDRDHPLKFVVCDPYMLLMMDINNSGLPDALLIEQLYLELDMLDLVRHVQAIRGLAKSISTVAKAAKPLPAREQARQQAKSSSTSIPAVNNASVDKSLSLQFSAFVDCLFGFSITNSFSTRTLKLSTTSHTLFERIEGVAGLLQWTLDHAPEVSYTFDDRLRDPADTAVALKLTEDEGMIRGNWEGARLLLRYLLELCIDRDTGAPVLCSEDEEFLSMNEGLLLLRFTTLTATAMVKSQAGVTPMEIPTLYLYMADHIARYREIERPKRATSTNQGTTLGAASMDDSYPRAILMFAMSHFRFDQNPAMKAYNVPMLCRVKDMAISYIQHELQQTSANQKQQFKRCDRNFNVQLPMGGLAMAAALHCVLEVDRHFLQLYYSDVKGTVSATLPASVSGDSATLFPITIGACSQLELTQFFLPTGQLLSNSKLPSTVITITRQHQIHLQSKFPSEDFGNAVRPALVRIVALDGYVRHCLAQYLALVEWSQEAHHGKIPDNAFLAAALEAVLTVIQYDPSMKVRQDAALVWLYAVLDLPSRNLAAALTLGYRNLCCVTGGGCSDIGAFTYVEPRSCIDIPKILQQRESWTHRIKSALHKGTQQGMKKELKRWWKLICVASNTDKVTRSLLLSAWTYVYHNRIPKALHHHATTGMVDGTVTASTELSAALIKFPDPTDNEPVELELPALKDPLDSYYRIELCLRRGSDFKITNASGSSGNNSHAHAGGAKAHAAADKKKGSKGTKAPKTSPVRANEESPAPTAARESEKTSPLTNSASVPLAPTQLQQDLAEGQPKLKLSISLTKKRANASEATTYNYSNREQIASQDQSERGRRSRKVVDYQAMDQGEGGDAGQSDNEDVDADNDHE